MRPACRGARDHRRLALIERTPHPPLGVCRVGGRRDPLSGGHVQLPTNGPEATHGTCVRRVATALGVDEMGRPCQAGDTYR
jgi:hypothetical protein